MTERIIDITQPKRLNFGPGCLDSLGNQIQQAGVSNIYLLVAPELLDKVNPILDGLRADGIKIQVDTSIFGEPTISMLEASISSARSTGADCVLGVGGGSVMDVAKGVAAMIGNDQLLEDAFGIGNLQKREPFLILAPTTSGTGSEVSPNAIYFDESVQLKRAIISPLLVADAVFVEPELTLTAPPGLTAASGMDALTHCIEAYTNKFAHPMVDGFALQGIRLISQNLEQAVIRGDNLEARINLAQGSLFGGMCLGPVNTAGVHALAYPLEGIFKIPHGLANSILLPYVMSFNLEANEERYADVALAMGVRFDEDTSSTALKGIEATRDLADACGIPAGVPQLAEVPEKIEDLADSAMTVTRLLRNNPREITRDDAIALYKNLVTE
jgi:alcohol dehydrogenase class IV